MHETITPTPISRRPEGATPSRQRGDRPARRTFSDAERNFRWVEAFYLAQGQAALDRQTAAAGVRRRG